jgi:hypothetical protein
MYFRIQVLLTLHGIRVTSIPEVKKLLLETLPTEEKKRAYHYSNSRDSRAVAKFAGVGHVAVTRWWKTWVRAGMAKTISAKRGERTKSVFSLEDFGIEMPPQKEIKPKKKEAPTKPTEEQAQKPLEEKS